MHSSAGVDRGWRRLAQVLLGLALVGGLGLAVVQAFAGGYEAASRIFHVSLAWMLWPLSLAAAAAARDLAGWQRGLARFGLFLAAAGALLSVVVVLLADGRDAYSSALPVLRHPVHGASLGLFGLGVLAVFVARGSSLLSQRMRGGGLVWYVLVPLLAAGFSALWAWDATGELEGPVRLSYAFWGPANLVPFLFSALTMLGWLWLVGGAPPGWRARFWRHLCLVLAVAPALLVVPIQLEVTITDPEYFAQFDRMVMLGAWPAAVLLFVSLLPELRRAWRVGRRVDAGIVLGSAGLFFVGAFLGWGGDDTGTIFRAQVHLSAGALLLVSLALGDRWGGVSSGQTDALVSPTWRIALIVLAFALLAGGLGLYGIAERWWGRMPDSAYSLAQGSVMVGGVLLLVALWGGALRNLASGWQGGLGGLWRRVARVYSLIDLRVRAAFATVAAIVVVGAVIALLPAPGGEPVSPAGGSIDDRHRHVVEMRREEVRLRFEQGVAMLHAQRHDEAATAFHRVLQLAPDMPEAHVNMGFAMLGVRDYKVARDFFEGAIELRTDQLNAYYGLALAYEALGNLDGAIGAMRTYQHLTAPDDPYLPQVVTKLRAYQAKRSQASGGESSGERVQ